MATGFSLKCSVCLELYTDPRVLPCLHTLCLDCVKGLVTNDSLNCPQCRAKHQVAEGGVVSYPVDLSILPELEAAKVKSGQQQKKVCGLCTTGDEAVGYCGDCGEYLCEYCHGHHKRGKMFLSHQVTPVSDVSSVTASSSSKQPSFCLHHPEYKLEIYCRNCCSLVCCKCMLELSHKGHQYELIENAQEEITEKVESLAQIIGSKENTFQACLELAEKIEKLALSKQEEIRLKIKAFYDELMLLVEAVFTEDNKKIWSTKNDLEMMLSQIKSSRSFSSHVKEQVGNNQYLSLVNQVLQSLLKLQSADMTNPMKEVWSITSTSVPFQEKINSVIDLTNLPTFCPEGQQRDQLKAKPAEITIPEHSLTNKVVASLEQPFAKLTKWNCHHLSTEGIDDQLLQPNVHLGIQMVPTVHAVAVAVADDQLEVEFNPEARNKYIVHLTPTNIPLNVEFEITVLYKMPSLSFSFEELSAPHTYFPPPSFVPSLFNPPLFTPPSFKY